MPARLADRKSAPPKGREHSGPTVGVALGGGGARGLAHIHVIEALDEMGIRPTVMAGTSIGSIIGAGVAAGMSGRDIHEFAEETLGQKAEVLSRIWRSRPSSISELVEGGVRLGQFNVERILRSFLPESIPGTFAELAIPLRVAATDYYAHETLVMEEGDLPRALAASSAIPAVFRPIQHRGRLLIDGGFSNPVPFDLLRDRADIVIAVDVVGAPVAESPKIPNTIDLSIGASQIVMQQVVALKLKEWRPHILLRPAVSRYKVLDFLKIANVLESSRSIREETKRAVEAAFEGIESTRS
ncbi:patatin-like phospholipase family protein [Chelativorans sp. ZYF759]|uniref:patatin-like phospholipase family protein n=1 Tax=Chelativorans sp. ZYF759 TaxID=2692213 RepID=UPI00145EB06F|nr:patatin-like phospholipase family protein [Chelativorans sp. ZYF759]NMG37681.1 patatin-like phospholipase family protein [Chelativorans sp. ZYF759]